MSGPKVIRIATREELLARALDQIAQLEAAVRRYATLGRRHDMDISAEIAARHKEIAELKALTQTNAWDKIALRCVEGARFVDHERRVLEENLIAAATKDRTVRRRLKEVARAIQREAKTLKLTVPGELDNVVANADTAEAADLQRMDAAIAAASRALVQHASKSRSVDVLLAKRLAAGLDQPTLTGWLASNAIGAESQNSLRLDKILTELQFRQIAITEPIAAAIQRIQTAGDDKRDLLIDSLTIELSGILKNHEQRGEELARVELQIGRLEREGSSDAQALIHAAKGMISTDVTSDFSDWKHNAERFLKISEAKVNAIGQRKALLSGLTALGYEIREGMATALVVNGRLVVKKPAEVEYGVEIVSGANDGRLQVRMVSFQSSANPTRDKDVEVIWCGEFSHLQEKLARAGHSLLIEKALAPGVAAMKREQLSTDSDIDANVKQPLTRSR